MIPGLKKRALNFHDVVMYVALARKHVRLMMLLMCLTLLTGLVYYVFARPVYYSKSLVKMDYVALPMDTDKLYHDGRIRAVIKEMLSPVVVERTAKSLGLPANERTIEMDYVFKTSVHTNTMEKTLEIDVWPKSLALADRWAEALVREYLDYRQEKRIRDRDELIAAYMKEVEEVTGKLDGNFNERFERKDEQDVTEATIKAHTLQSIPTDLVRLTKRIDDMGRVRVRLQDPALDVVAKLSLIASLEQKQADLSVGQEVKITPQTPDLDKDDDDKKEGSASNGGVVVVPSMMKSSKPWEDLDKQRQQIKQQMAAAAEIYLPGHHKMVALQKQMDEVDRQLQAEFQTAENRFSLEYQELINKRTDLESRLPEYEEITKKSAKIRQDEVLYNAAQLPWKRYYGDLKKRIEALDFASEKERIDLTYMGVIDKRDVPVSPNRGKLLMICMMLGGVIALGVPFLIEYLDHTMSNLEQVESTFQLRGLGIIPKLEDEVSPDRALITSTHESEGHLIENFRVIRTNLLSMGAITKAPQMMMVTSAMPREGKTVVSSNLAISFAQTGARTLLMDTDLRRGRLHRLFGYRKSPGLSNVLLGECSLDEALRPTLHDNLTVLSAGKHLDTGTELLGSKHFADVLTELRSRFDRIIVDTPPVLGLSETSVMQPLVDGVVFVIWSGNTPIRNMKAAIEMLQSNGANFYGFVLNRLDLNSTANYYQYYYYSHDYYYHYRPHAIENA